MEVWMCGLHQRTFSPLNRLVYALVFLLIWAQYDDYWAVPGMPSAPQAEDDEYLPAQQRPQEDECASHRKSEFVGLKPHLADLPLDRSAVPFEWKLPTLFTPSPLYLLMSLQI
jgi:hypothetical protein